MKRSLQRKVNVMHTADTEMLSRKGVSMESLVENTLPDDEKEEAAAKRLHEKALQEEQELPMTIGGKTVLALMYAICMPCFTAVVVSFFVLFVLTFDKQGPEVCKTMIMFALLYFGVAALLLLILLFMMKVFPNIAKRLDVLLVWDFVCAVLPAIVIVENIIYYI